MEARKLKPSGIVELNPDRVCEIVSPGHERKDTLTLFLLLQRPDSEELLDDQEGIERARYRGEWVTRTLRRKRRIPYNDLPGIAAAYRSFRAEHPEPGIVVVATGSLES